MKKVIALLLSFVVQITFSQEKMFTITASAENISGHRLVIDHPSLNENPDAVIVANFNESPNGEGDESPTPNKPILASYTGTQNKWYIAFKDLSPMVVNLSFNVYIADVDKGFRHIANTDNSDENYTYLDHPELNGNPDNATLMTPESVENEHQGLWYDGANWSVYNEGIEAFEIPSYYNIIVGGGDVQTFRHIVTAENIHPDWEDVTVLDHPLLNGNPDAKFVFTHNWGQTGGTHVILNKALMAEYFNEKWNISTADLSAITNGAMFDIYVYDETMSVGDMEAQTKVAVYPNPVLDVVNFNSKSIIKKITIYDLSGKLISEFQIDSIQTQINLSNLKTSIYLAKIQTLHGIQILKLIKK